MGGQAGGGGGEGRLVDLVGELDGLLLDRPVGQHHDQEGHPRAQPHELHRADGGRLVRWPDHHRRAVGQVGQEPGGPLEHHLDLAVGVLEELPDLLTSVRVQRARAGQVVDEEPVPLVGRDPTRAGVGLGQKALSFEQGHVRAHRGRRHADPRGVHHVLRSHRLGRADVLGDDGVEDGRLAGVELAGAGGALLGSAVVGGSHRCPVWGSKPRPAGPVGIRGAPCWHSTLVSAEPFRTVMGPRRGISPGPAPAGDRVRPWPRTSAGSWPARGRWWPLRPPESGCRPGPGPG